MPSLTLKHLTPDNTRVILCPRHKEALNSTYTQQLSTFLRKYVDEHFETEERVMREMRYPLLELRRQQRARFTRDFLYLDVELRKKIVTQKTFMLFKIQLLVVDWIANHTMKLDKHFGRFVGCVRAR